MMGRVTSECPVCSAPTEPWATSPILGGRHTATYVRCTDCGLIRATDVDWLDDAYAQPIADADIGLLDRCDVLANCTSALLASFAPHTKTGFLDWGGGYGVFTRTMRDRGFDFSDYEPYAPNLFAGPHRLDTLPPRGDSRFPPFTAVTAFEVLEHLVDPVTELAEVASLAQWMIVTTQPVPDPAPKPGEWDYYSLETGQHVTFYTPAALEELADRLGFKSVVTGRLLHVFSKSDVALGPIGTWIAQHHKVAYLRGWLHAPLQRRKSLLPEDQAVRTTSIC